MENDRKFIDACMNLDLNSVVNFVEKYGKDYITKKYIVNNVYTSVTPLGAVVITFHPYISNKGINNCLELCKYLIDNGASLYEMIERTDWDIPFSIREYMKGKHIFHKENKTNIQPELLWFNEIYDTFLNYLEDYERENDEILSVKDPGE